MKELDVVVDVRPSADTDELIVTKQTVSFSGDADLVGGPKETRVRFAHRKAQLSPTGYLDITQAFTIGVKVKNVGVAPFTVDRVAIEYQPERSQTTPLNGESVSASEGGSVVLHPAPYTKPGDLLLAGEALDYILPTSAFEDLAIKLIGLSPSRYWIAAYSRGEEVGRLGGEQFRLLLSNVTLRFHRRAQPLFDTLPEPSRLAVIRTVTPLRNVDPKDWPAHGAKPLEEGGETFVVDPGENLLVLLTPFQPKGVEIADIVQKTALRQFHEATEDVTQ